MHYLTLKHWGVVYAVLIGLLLLVLLQWASVHQHLKVTVLDVGQGDAILIQTPEYHTVLIDAGADSVVMDQLGETLGFFDKTIDLFILTHPHRDHYGGILDVMQKYRIKKILLTGVASRDPMYLEFLEVAKRQSEILFARSDQDVWIAPDLYLDILYPFAGQSLMGQEVNNLNNVSVVTKLLHFQNDHWEPLFMLMGDAEQEEEREILLAGQNVTSSILKIGHHGSRTATSDAFLAAVSPMTAVISVGKDNSFQHPHPETMEKLADLEVRQTMEEGMIEFNF